MELDNYKQMWAEVNAKLDRNWRLNLDIIRRANLDQAKGKLHGLIWVKALSLAFYLLFAGLFIAFAVTNWTVPHMAATGVILAVWSLAICMASVHELELITSVDYSQPISQLQMRLSRIRLVIIRYLRLGVWIIPLYFVFIVLLFKVAWGLDIVAVGDRTWIIANLVLSVVVFLPFAIWAHFKLSPKNAQTNWMNSLLRGNGSQITDALSLIEEIEDFQREEK